jgi:hypothetical protein
MALSGIEAATFRLVVQYLKQLRHRVPHVLKYSLIIREQVGSSRNFRRGSQTIDDH